MILNLILQQQSMDLPTPFQQDFDVNAIDMLGLKAQAIQEGVQYAFWVYRIQNTEWKQQFLAKIFIRGKSWPSFL